MRLTLYVIENDGEQPAFTGEVEQALTKALREQHARGGVESCEQRLEVIALDTARRYGLDVAFYSDPIDGHPMVTFYRGMTADAVRSYTMQAACVSFLPGHAEYERIDVKAAQQMALREYHANQGSLLAGEYLPGVEDIAARVAADCAAPFIY